MLAFIAIIEALASLMGPMATLFKDVMSLWADFHGKTGTDPDTTANDAMGAAEAFVALDKDAEQAIADVTAQLKGNHPQADPVHLHALAAMAVQRRTDQLKTDAAPKAQ